MPANDVPPHVRIGLTTCPGCGGRINAVGQVGAKGVPLPNPGDVVACLGCGIVSQFASDRKTLCGFDRAEAEALVRDTETMNSLAETVQGIHNLRIMRAAVN